MDEDSTITVISNASDGSEATGSLFFGKEEISAEFRV